MQGQVTALLLVAAVAMGRLPPPSFAAAVDGEATVAAERRADAEASADPGAGGSSFFDTFMAFLGSSALHQHQPDDAAAGAGGRQEAADGGGDEQVAAAASDAAPALHQYPEQQGRSLHAADLGIVAGAPLQDGGQAERVKRTGALPAQLLGGVLSHKLNYLASKGSHHVHYHNYNTKCDKPHFSLWEFKKGILHKLLEAAKAIGGGVLALKGKLITAKGHLVAAKGRKLATKGEELTEFGKSILAKALGHGGHEEVAHSAPSAPSAPAAALYAGPAPPSAHGYGGYEYGAPQFAAPQFAAPQYLPPQIGPAPGGHGYNAAVSLLNEYSRAGFGHAPAPALAPHARAHALAQQRTGQAPTGPSATGPAGTLPGNLQAGLLVLQAAPSASGPQRNNGILAVAASSHHSAAVAAPAAPAPSDDAAALSAPSASELVPLYNPRSSNSAPAQPLVLAPEYMDAAMAAPESNKVRRYAPPTPSRRSLDAAMAAVVRGLQGPDLLLHPDIIRTAAAAGRFSAAASP